MCRRADKNNLDTTSATVTKELKEITHNTLIMLKRMEYLAGEVAFAVIGNIERWKMKRINGQKLHQITDACRMASILEWQPAAAREFAARLYIEPELRQVNIRQELYLIAGIDIAEKSPLAYILNDKSRLDITCNIRFIHQIIVEIKRKTRKTYIQTFHLENGIYNRRQIIACARIAHDEHIGIITAVVECIQDTIRPFSDIIAGRRVINILESIE